jgi:hypothetical protein
MLAGIIIVTGVLMSLAMLRLGSQVERLTEDRLRAERQRLEKPKRGDSLAELIDVLDDADAEDLRHHIKQRLMKQVDSGSTEDVESFEELLADAGRKAKRGS